MEDQANNLQIKRAISPVSVGDNTATVSQIIDLYNNAADNVYESCTFAINIGAVADADATFTVLLEEGNAADMSDHTAVADEDMISQTPGVAPEAAASFQFDSDNQVRKLGYVGHSRYLRMTITPANNAGAAVFGVLAVLGNALVEPVVQALS